MNEVDRLVGIYPVIQQELDELRDSIASYAKKTRSKNPAPYILSNALKTIREDEKERFIQELQGSEKEIQVKRVNIVPIWSIAASILLVISLGFNYIFFTEFKSAKAETDILRTNFQSLQEDQTVLADLASNQKMELEYASLRIAHFLNEDNIHVRMDGLEMAPESFANVFWNKKTNSVFISVDNLPEPPHGHQYQLWAIKSGIAPIDAGIFDHSKPFKN